MGSLEPLMTAYGPAVLAVVLFFLISRLLVLSFFRKKTDRAPMTKEERDAVYKAQGLFELQLASPDEKICITRVSKMNLVDVRIHLKAVNPTPLPITIENITWTLWLSNQAHVSILNKKFQIPPRSDETIITLREAKDERATEELLSELQYLSNNTIGYLEGLAVCRIKKSVLEKRFCFFNLPYTFETKASTLKSAPPPEDALTGLYTRHFLDAHLQDIIAGTVPRGPLSLLIIDLDDFKPINDLYGHLKGDEALQLIAHELKTLGEERAISVRYGGDEFIVILQECPISDAYAFAENIRSRVAALPFTTPQGVIFKLTLSIGVAMTSTSLSSKVLIQWADEALHLAKKDGKNLVRVNPRSQDPGKFL